MADDHHQINAIPGIAGALVGDIVGQCTPSIRMASFLCIIKRRAMPFRAAMPGTMVMKPAIHAIDAPGWKPALRCLKSIACLMLSSAVWLDAYAGRCWYTLIFAKAPLRCAYKNMMTPTETRKQINKHGGMRNAGERIILMPQSWAAARIGGMFKKCRHTVGPRAFSPHRHFMAAPSPSVGKRRGRAV